MNQNRKVNFQNYLFLNKNKLITLIILSSLIIKLIFLKFFKLPQFYDVQTYIDTVNFFLNGISVSDQIMPMYPIIVYTVQSIFNIQIFNILLSCLTAVLFFNLTKYILDNILFRITVLTFISFYPYNIFYSITGF